MEGKKHNSGTNTLLDPDSQLDFAFDWNLEPKRYIDGLDNDSRRRRSEQTSSDQNYPHRTETACQTFAQSVYFIIL